MSVVISWRTGVHEIYNLTEDEIKGRKIKP